jgi:TonB family protein
LSFAIGISFAIPASAQDTPSQTNTPPATEKVEHVGGKITPPKVIFQREPEFSDQARAAGYEGICTLRLVVGADGLPRNIRVLNAIGMGLDEKAVAAVSTWRFDPALKDGKPIPVEIAVEVDFHLYGSQTSKLLERARAGDPKAELQLAKLYFKGKAVPLDERIGMGYLEKAARQGLPEAQFLMGEHRTQQAALPDYVTAYAWYTLAQRNHYKHADKALKGVSAKMTDDQIRAGQSMADTLLNGPGQKN